MQKDFRPPWRILSFCASGATSKGSGIFKHTVRHPSISLEDHAVFIHVHRAVGVALRRGLDDPLQCEVVDPCGVPVVASVMVMSGHEAHHTLVGLQDGQNLVKVPGQTNGVSGVWVYWKVT